MSLTVAKHNRKISRLVNQETFRMQGGAVDSTFGAMSRARSKSQYPKEFLAMLAAAGYASPHALTTAIGRPDALRGFASGRTRSIRSDILFALAAKLGQPADAVRQALGLPSVLAEPAPGGFDPAKAETLTRIPVRRPGAHLPVRFAVQAGAWIERDELTQVLPEGPPVGADPRYPPDQQWLELVRGDSVDLYYPEGAWVHVVDAIAIGYAARDKDFVTIERTREQGGLIERSLKQVSIKAGKIELWPRSRNPRWNGPLPLGEPRDVDDAVRIAALVIGGYVPARR